jgi:hypothetical protein
MVLSNFEGLTVICLTNMILDYTFQVGDWRVELGDKNVIKARGIEQGENTLPGSPQCVGGESRAEMGHLRRPTTTRRLRWLKRVLGSERDVDEVKKEGGKTVLEKVF